MTSSQFLIYPQTQVDHNQVEALLDDAFGLDRQTKSSYRLREGETPVTDLSFIAKTIDNKIIGTISFWHIHLGHTGTKAILLGPLAVAPNQQSAGVGLALMRHGITAAKAQGHKLIILVGDAPYYAKIGFQQVPLNTLLMPGPNDPARLLYLELEDGAFNQPTGLIRSPSRWQDRA